MNPRMILALAAAALAASLAPAAQAATPTQAHALEARAASLTSTVSYARRFAAHDRQVIRDRVEYVPLSPYVYEVVVKPDLGAHRAHLALMNRVLERTLPQLQHVRAKIRAARNLAECGHPGQPVAIYACELARARGWTGYEWAALDTVVGRESAWNPCASYPRRHDCGYAGSSACGVPQANPCPSAWRGRLASTWRSQVEWLVDYVSRKYGAPSRALAVWNAQQSY